MKHRHQTPCSSSLHSTILIFVFPKLLSFMSILSIYHCLAVANSLFFLWFAAPSIINLFLHLFVCAQSTWLLKSEMEKAEKKVLSHEERHRERENKREQGGLNNMIEVHLADLMDYAQENPFPVSWS